jgi:hypothetical protein
MGNTKAQTMEEQNSSDETAQLREKAFQQLKANGPMKAKALAGALGLTGAHNLLAALQSDSKRFLDSGGWSQLKTK